MKKRIVLFFATFSLALAAVAQVKPVAKPAAVKPVLKNATDSFSYAAGMNIATSLKEQGVPAINSKALAQALDDYYSGKTLLLKKEEADMTLQQKLQEYSRRKTDAEKAKGLAFLTENKKRKGVVALPNGLQYEVLLKGKDSAGTKPNLSDKVVVHYTGMLTDGTVFDSSVKHGAPASFQLTGVIRGWTEILQLMQKGDKWKVYIPSDLGYGDGGYPPSIPPGATLVFEIELLDIQPAAQK